MKKLIILLTIASLGLYTCGPSVEGESKAWKSNTAGLEQLAKDYPPFSEKIDAQIKEAEKIYMDAQDITDEDKKADKLREANSKLEQGCVGKLKNTDKMIEDIRSKTKELQDVRKGLPESDIRYADIVIKEAETSISNIRTVMSRSKSEISGDPCTEFESAYNQMEIRLEDMKMAVKNLKRTKSDLEAKDKEVKSEDKTISTEKTEVTKVECEYCGTMNPSDATECKSCGAPIK